MAVLSVERSLKNCKWVLPSADDDTIARIMQAHALPEYIARLLALRGIAPEDVTGFLYPSLKNCPDPFSLAGMGEMAAFVAQGIVDGKKFGIFADFDVDGATSAAILTRFLKHAGVEPDIYIPDRLEEGYGPNINAFKQLKEQGVEILFVADCGITAFDVIAQGRALGLDIIVLDHHEAEENLPDAAHVINPKRRDDASGLTMLAACGVCFLSCVAINKVLREKGFYDVIARPEAPLKSWMDILALGTVCDMVPMTGPNRLFVRAGFQQMAQRNNPGINAIFEVAGITAAPTPDHAGFTLGPRINAGSRVHKSDLGAKLLSTDDMDEARAIAWTLEDCNEQRKEVQSTMVKEATAMVDREGLEKYPVIFVGHESWHPGLSGLVAGKLKDKYGKPAVVVTYAKNADGTMEGRGSGRSVTGINMAQIFIDASNEGLLEKGGGHAMAGGFTVLPDRIDAFRAFVMDHAAGQRSGKSDRIEETVIDSIASVRGARVDQVRLLTDHMGPFGVGHAEPVFALTNVRIHLVDILKDKHIRVQFSDWEGGVRMKAMLFYGVGTTLGDTLVKHGKGEAWHLAGQFKINEWQGRETVEFFILDAAPINGADRVAA
jgi:single-stranded-DNA-specific exonuclease